LEALSEELREFTEDRGILRSAQDA
jgi:hypothetical protein